MPDVVDLAGSVVWHRHKGVEDGGEDDAAFGRFARSPGQAGRGEVA